MAQLTSVSRRRPPGPQWFRPGGGLRARLLLVLLAGAVPPAQAQGPVADEYAVKAACVLSVARFVEWPPRDKQSQPDGARVCVLGADPIGETVEEVAHGKQLHGHPVEVFRGRRLSELGDCDVLFIAASEHDRLHQHLDALKGQPVLTVSDAPGFAAGGGMVGLCLEDRRVCIEVNRIAIGQAGLEVSSRLLALAREVIGASPEEASW